MLMLRKRRIYLAVSVSVLLWVYYKTLMETKRLEDIQNSHLRVHIEGGEEEDPGQEQELMLTNVDGNHYERSSVAPDQYMDTCALALESFEVNSSSKCLLPILDPFNEQIMKLMTGSEDRISCPGERYFTYNNGVLSLMFQEDSLLKNFTVQSITRKPKNDWGFVLNNKPFNYPRAKSSKINKEFLRIEIETSWKKTVEYHAEVIPKPKILQRKAIGEGLNMNVLMVGFDSTSSAQMQRAMPEVYRLLKDDLDSYIFRGYSIVGDGTTPQLTAILTGHHEAELPEARRGYPNSSTVDSWPWIFKEYRNNGYVTMYSEDDADYNSFNYRLHGFQDPPTDHYARTFWQAALTENFCIKSMPQPEVHFSYIESFMRSYKSIPKFGLAFLSSISHDNLNNLKRGQEYALGFFKSLKELGYLNDTILVVFSDHGVRFGEARALIQGRLEERLPFLSITLPKSLRERYKELDGFLKENTEKLTSPFDLHATLHHILTYSRGQVYLPRYGMSLFRRIPDRGCSDCGIPEHYCPCVQLKKVPIKHPHIETAARRLVEKINGILSGDKLAVEKCAKLKLREVKLAHQNLNHPKVIQFRGSDDGHGRIPKLEKNAKYYECNYHLVVRTAPGDALFEATAQLLDGRFHFGKDVSRINKYGDQPKCIADVKPYLRKFCFCKVGI